jgi:hypothetical protein
MAEMAVTYPRHLESAYFQHARDNQPPSMIGTVKHAPLLKLKQAVFDNLMKIHEARHTPIIEEGHAVVDLGIGQGICGR